MTQSQTSTKTKRDSRHDVKGYLMPARGFFFVVTEEIGRDGFLVRNVYASENDPHLLRKVASGKIPEERIKNEVHPEKYGMLPKAPGASVTVAEHVLSNNLSSYLSASTILPGGAPNFDGPNIYIDIRKAKRSGAKIISTDEILQALEDYKAQYPARHVKIDRIAAAVRDVSKEVLVKTNRLPPSMLFTRQSLKTALGISKYVRVVQTLGIVFTAYDLEEAGKESFETHRAKPIEKEVVRQAGGWGAGMLGFRVGAAAGAVLGIEIGPGAIITGAIGGIIFGSIGYFAGSKVAEQLGN